MFKIADLITTLMVLEDLSEYLLAEVDDDLEMRHAYRDHLVQASAQAAGLFNTSYDENSASDYQVLLRNAFFRETVARLAMAHDRAEINPRADKARDDTANSKATLKNSSRLNDRGVEQLSTDPAFRAMMEKADPDLLLRLDIAVTRSEPKPASPDITHEEKLEFVRNLFNEARARKKLNLWNRFMFAVAPGFTCSAALEQYEMNKEASRDKLLARLKSRVPASGHAGLQ